MLATHYSCKMIIIDYNMDHRYCWKLEFTRILYKANKIFIIFNDLNESHVLHYRIINSLELA